MQLDFGLALSLRQEILFVREHIRAPSRESHPYATLLSLAIMLKEELTLLLLNRKPEADMAARVARAPKLSRINLQTMGADR